MSDHEELYNIECWAAGVALKADLMFRVQRSYVLSLANVRLVDIGICISSELRNILEADMAGRYWPILESGFGVK